MSAMRQYIFENTQGQKVRTFAVESDQFNLVYILNTRRIEAVNSLKDLEDENINYQLLKKIETRQISDKGLDIGSLGRIRPQSSEFTNSPTFELAEENDDEQLRIFLNKTAITHITLVLLLILGGWIWNRFFTEKQEPQLVTIVLPKSEIKKEKVQPAPHVKVAEKKIKPSKKVYRPHVAKRKVLTKKYHTRTAKNVDVRRVGALAALGGLPSGTRGYEGLDRNSTRNIRSAGEGRGGGGIGSAGRGGIKGYLPGKGLIAGSSGNGGKAVSAGGYGTRGHGGGKAGYGKIAIVGGTSAVSLPMDDEATVEGGLDRDQIIAVINKNRGQIVYCYEKGLQRQPDIGGRVSVSFVIGPNGRVSTAKVAQTSLASRMVENCIVSKLRTWHFPQPVGRVNVDVLYPFELMRVSSR